MKSENDIEQLVKNTRVKTSPPIDEQILAAAQAALENSAPAKPNIWKAVMKSPITKLAAAAVILIAVLIGINQFGGSLDGASVALADVAKKIEQIKHSVFKKTTIWSSQDNGTNTIDSLVYYAEACIRADIYDDKKITNQVYVNSSEGIVVGIDHKRKLFKKMDLTDEDIQKLPLMGPKDIVNLILSKGKYKRLGKKEIDGVLSEGFEFNDKRALLSMDKDIIENVVTRLWIDVNTKLPIRIELDAVLIDDLKANVVMCDPKWDVGLESDFFEPKIPVDYITLKQRGFIGINLDNWPTLKVSPGMAAEKAGVKDGDVVLKVNGDSILHIKSPEDAEILLFGKIGDKATLTVKRAEQILTFEIEREPLPK